MGPSKLLTQAEELLRTGRADEALPIATSFLARLQRDRLQTLPALNLLGEINLELGNADKARNYFLAAAHADPDGSIPESQGGGAEKLLWLAQLSEEGGQDSVDWFERGAVILRRIIAATGDVEVGKEKRKKLSEALCGIIEVYMTDLSWETDAEVKCESLITEALLVAPHSPEPLQTLASIRISQTRIQEARKALADSISLWKHLPPEDTGVPDFPTRISLARLLMEVEMEEEALEVVERLVTEDDQSVEAWYLGGWCLYLLGEKRKNPQDTEAVMHDGKQGEDNLHLTALVSSRDWLRQSLTLYEMLEYEDERLRDHAEELVDGLDAQLREYDSKDEGDGLVDREDDGLNEEEEDEEEDHEMDES
ncbi:hypothetical protein N7G274_003944 [Stereocaulon virgatum]|uniref:TPR domain-containing protein n=1 Tax=Stereocaulon virgatum TaxID=373712 RepID=A0ABR4AGD5_9LECA